MKVSFGEPALPKTGAKNAVLVLLGVKDAVLGEQAEALDQTTGGFLARAVETTEWKAGHGAVLELLTPADMPFSRILLLGLGDPAALTAQKLQEAGGRLAAKLIGLKAKEASVLIDREVLGEEDKGGPFSAAEMAALIASGAHLRNYAFDKYKTEKGRGAKKKRKAKAAHRLQKLAMLCAKPGTARKRYQTLERVASGVFLTRDLVSEPANVLHPESFAERIEQAFEGTDGVKVEVLNEKQMRKLGMAALLGVGQGSRRESRLVVIDYRGGGEKEAPLAFVGKGVTFDTGGISIKPSSGMEQMKWDMGGAGTVVGLMKALVERKAKVNAVGVVGLVENMPDGQAQRPGDVVTSMSGQTIEILNTDAEGRLVLADALWYTQDRFKPELMIDLATLTGAMIVALGAEYSGLFSNDNGLADRLFKAGLAVDEKVWRFPLHASYDRDINSEIADVKNIGSGGAGSITAAQFLKRFVNDVTWAHLDIAGTTWSKKDLALAPKGGSGFGVRLLDRFVADNYG